LWSSPVQDVTSELKASGIGNYNLSAWIKGTANDRSQVCVALTDSIGTHWVATDFKTINSTSWIQNAKYCNITWTGELISAKVYVQTEMYGWDIYVDDFVLTR